MGLTNAFFLIQICSQYKSLQMDIIQDIKNLITVMLIGQETNPAAGKNITKWKSNIKLQAKRKDQRMSSSFYPQNAVQTSTMEQVITNLP